MRYAKKIHNTMRRFVISFFSSAPIPGAWLIVYALGAFQFSLLSIPSEGIYLLLIPLFALAGIFLAAGAWFKKCKWGLAGLIVMMFSSVFRAIGLWNIDQNGVGGNFIASSVWFWIAFVSFIFALALAYKGVEGEDW